VPSLPVKLIWSKVQNARALVADYADGPVRSSDGSCVVQ
jgi:hypothetical protein